MGRLTLAKKKKNEVYYMERVWERKTEPDGSFRYLTSWVGFAEKTWEPIEHFVNSLIDLVNELDRILDDPLNNPKPDWILDFEDQKRRGINVYKHTPRPGDKVIKREETSPPVEKVKGRNRFKKEWSPSGSTATTTTRQSLRRGRQISPAASTSTRPIRSTRAARNGQSTSYLNYFSTGESTPVTRSRRSSMVETPRRETAESMETAGQDRLIKQEVIDDTPQDQNGGAARSESTDEGGLVIVEDDSSISQEPTENLKAAPQAQNAALLPSSSSSIIVAKDLNGGPSSSTSVAPSTVVRPEKKKSKKFKSKAQVPLYIATPNDNLADNRQQADLASPVFPDFEPDVNTGIFAPLEGSDFPVFNWRLHLVNTGGAPAPVECFWKRRIGPFSNPFGAHMQKLLKVPDNDEPFTFKWCTVGKVINFYGPWVQVHVIGTDPIRAHWFMADDAGLQPFDSLSDLTEPLCKEPNNRNSTSNYKRMVEKLMVGSDGSDMRVPRECFVNQIPWKNRPVKNGFKVGHQLETYDPLRGEGCFYPATIVEVNFSRELVKIHYDGYPQNETKTVTYNDPRLFPCGFANAIGWSCVLPEVEVKKPTIRGRKKNEPVTHIAPSAPNRALFTPTLPPGMIEMDDIDSENGDDEDERNDFHSRQKNTAPAIPMQQISSDEEEEEEEECNSFLGRQNHRTRAPAIPGLSKKQEKLEPKKQEPTTVPATVAKQVIKPMVNAVVKTVEAIQLEVPEESGHEEIIPLELETDDDQFSRLLREEDVPTPPLKKNAPSHTRKAIVSPREALPPPSGFRITHTGTPVHLYVSKRCNVGPNMKPLEFREIPSLQFGSLPHLWRELMQKLVIAAVDQQAYVDLLPKVRANPGMLSITYEINETTMGGQFLRFPTSVTEAQNFLDWLMKKIGMCPNAISIDEKKKCDDRTCVAMRDQESSESRVYDILRHANHQQSMQKQQQQQLVQQMHQQQMQQPMQKKSRRNSRSANSPPVAASPSQYATESSWPLQQQEQLQHQVLLQQQNHDYELQQQRRMQLQRLQQQQQQLHLQQQQKLQQQQQMQLRQQQEQQQLLQLRLLQQQRKIARQYELQNLQKQQLEEHEKVQMQRQQQPYLWTQYAAPSQSASEISPSLEHQQQQLRQQQPAIQEPTSVLSELIHSETGNSPSLQQPVNQQQTPKQPETPVKKGNQTQSGAGDTKALQQQQQQPKRGPIVIIRKPQSVPIPTQSATANTSSAQKQLIPAAPYSIAYHSLNGPGPSSRQAVVRSDVTIQPDEQRRASIETSGQSAQGSSQLAHPLTNPHQERQSLPAARSSSSGAPHQHKVVILNSPIPPNGTPVTPAPAKGIIGKQPVPSNGVTVKHPTEAAGSTSTCVPPQQKPIFVKAPVPTTEIAVGKPASEQRKVIIMNTPRPSNGKTVNDPATAGGSASTSAPPMQRRVIIKAPIPPKEIPASQPAPVNGTAPSLEISTIPTTNGSSQPSVTPRAPSTENQPAPQPVPIEDSAAAPVNLDPSRFLTGKVDLKSLSEDDIIEMLQSIGIPAEVQEIFKKKKINWRTLISLNVDIMTNILHIPEEWAAAISSYIAFNK